MVALPFSSSEINRTPTPHKAANSAYSTSSALCDIRPHKLVQEAEQLLVHGFIVVGAQRGGLLHEAMRDQRRQLASGRLDQQLDYLRRELHVALEAVHQIAVFNDLPRAALAGRNDFRAVGQTRHVVVPVADLQGVTEVGELFVRPPLGREGDGEFANFLLRAVLMARAQRLADQLRTQADADDGLAGIDALIDQHALGSGVEVRILLPGGGRRLRAAHDHQQVDVFGRLWQRFMGIDARVCGLIASLTHPVFISARCLERFVYDKMDFHGVSLSVGSG